MWGCFSPSIYCLLIICVFAGNLFFLVVKMAYGMRDKTELIEKLFKGDNKSNY